MRLILSSLLLSLFFTVSALAKIEELKSYSDFDVSKLGPETLVIFDIDNTLLRQDHMIGTHQWGDYMREQLMKQGMDKANATTMQNRLFSELQPHLKVVPVEPKISEILKTLEKNKVPHLALTARNEGLKEITQKQLKFLNHSFEKNFPAQKDLRSKQALSFNGIVFSGDTPKGELLKKIVDNSKQAPQKIIFVDDKLYNLESIEKSFPHANLTSYRYAAADPILQAFDPKLANLEYSFFKEFTVVLPDSEAKALLDQPEKMAALRFKHYLKAQGKDVKASGVCKEHIAKTSYRCPYTRAGKPAMVQLDFDDIKADGIRFGTW